MLQLTIEIKEDDGMDRVIEGMPKAEEERRGME